MGALLVLTALASSSGDAWTRTGDPDTSAEDAGFPTEALDLLTRSTRDSCSICADRHRKEAFELLDKVYEPGRFVTSAPGVRYVLVPGGEDELAVTSYTRSEPRLTFRFHSASGRLVGIADRDLTEESIALQLRADAVRMGPHENSDSESARPDSVAPGGPHSGATPEYEGTIEIVAYDYGDGVSYLYSSSGNHLQIQCRILDISEAPMARE